MIATEAKAITSADLCRMIESKFAGDGSHLALFDVPDNVGLNSKRRADAIVIGNWGSTGRLVHGFEIKITRSDWLRELKHVDKADPFIARCDRWWLVTADDKLAKADEIPALWGWMTATKTGLRIQKAATIIPQSPDTLHKLFALGLIRKAYERSTGDVMSNPMVTSEIERIRADHARRINETVARQSQAMKRDLDEYKRQAEKFEADSGMKLTDWRLGNVGKLALAIHDMYADGYSSTRSRLTQQAKVMRDAAQSIDEALALMTETTA